MKLRDKWAFVLNATAGLMNLIVVVGFLAGGRGVKWLNVVCLLISSTLAWTYVQQERKWPQLWTTLTRSQYDVQLRHRPRRGTRYTVQEGVPMSTRSPYYDSVGRQLTTGQALSMFNNNYCPHIASTHIGKRWWISTVHLRINHNWVEDDPPILWETMVFDGDGSGRLSDVEMERYTSAQGAREGHERMVIKYHKKRPWLKVTDRCYHGPNVDPPVSGDLLEGMDP